MHHSFPLPENLARRHETLRRMRQRGASILFVSLFALGMGQSLFFAVLPPIARNIGLSEIETSIIFSLSAGLWVVCSPLWGRASDKWGRRPVILIGIGGFAVSTMLFAVIIAFALANAIAPFLVLPALMAARAIFGSCGCGAMPASFAYIADRTSRMRRTSGAAAVAAAFGVGNIAGPGIAALLVVFGVLTPFIAISAVALIGVIALAFLLPERIKPIRMEEKGSATTQDAIDTAPLLVVGLLFSVSQAVLIQLSAFFFMDTLDLPANADSIQLIGTSLTIMALANIFSQLLIIRLEGISVQFLLCAGALLGGVGFFTMSLSETYFMLSIGLAISGFAAGFTRAGLASAGSLTARIGHQGSVAGLIHATAAIGHFINPITGVLLYQFDPRSPFMMAAFLLVASSLIVVMNKKIRAIKPAGTPSTPPIDAPHLPHHHPRES